MPALFARSGKVSNVVHSSSTNTDALGQPVDELLHPVRHPIDPYTLVEVPCLIRPRNTIRLHDVFRPSAAVVSKELVRSDVAVSYQLIVGVPRRYGGPIQTLLLLLRNTQGQD